LIFLDNYIFGSKQTYTSLLSSSLQGSYISALSDVYTIVDR